MHPQTVEDSEPGKDKLQNSDSVWTIFLIFLRLGLTSFGGPIAHLGYFRAEFVNRRQWLTDKSYADLVALCQFLPGPASSQVGLALGLSRQGYAGAFAAWAGFTLPSAVMLILFASGISHYGNIIPVGALHGLKIVAVAVVAQAVWGMAQNLCTTTIKISIMGTAACVALVTTSSAGQVGIIISAALAGLFLFKPTPATIHDPLPIKISHRAGVLWLSIFFGLLIGLPILNNLFPYPVFAQINSFFRTGALVFGGGHVVLPLLQTAVVPTGWVSNDAFLAGYGATQAVPGPLFTFAAFLGASMKEAPGGWIGGIICLVAIYAPSFLLVTGVLPFWEKLRHHSRTQAALMSVNAAVVGLLLAALYQLVWTNAIHQPKDFGMAVIAFLALMFWKLPPWLVVVGCGFVGWFLAI